MTIAKSSLDSLSVLSRCLATENIIVRQDSSAQTASFDLESRVLTLPVWENMNRNQYDMLIGHEVAHALYTPADVWGATIEAFNGDKALFQRVVNIIEDERIERMIKAKFPGLRRDFHVGYERFAENDLFNIAGKDVSELHFMDRANIHFKIGPFMDVPFSAEERAILDRFTANKSFDDVIALARELYDAAQEDMQNDDQGETEQGEGEGEGETINSDAAGQSMDQDGEQDGESGDAGNGQGESEGDDAEGDNAGESKGEGTMESAEDGEDDGTSAEGEEGDAPGAGSEQGEGGRGTTIGSTSDAMTDNLAAQTRSAKRPYENNDTQYKVFPQESAEKFVVSSADLTKIIGVTKNEDACRANLTQFRNDSKKIVNQMVQQFQRKCAADEWKRTETSKTGRLDINKVHSYKFNDDIFLSQTEVADGKSHCIVFFLDWSASMRDILMPSMQQVVNQVDFCKKAGIDFRVVAFSDRFNWDADNKPEWDAGEEACCHDGFALLEFVDSRMNKRAFERGMLNLWMMACNAGHHNEYNGVAPMWEDVNAHRQLGLGGTPLHSALVSAASLVNEFQAATRSQIAHSIFVTDGDGHGCFYGSGDCIIADDANKTQVVVEDSYRGVQDTLAKMLTQKISGKVINLFLTPSKQCNMVDLQEQWKKEGWAARTWTRGFSEWIDIKAQPVVNADEAFDKVTAGDSLTKVRNAFMKGAAKKSASRNLINRVIDTISAA